MSSLTSAVILFKSETESNSEYDRELQSHAILPIFISPLRFALKNLPDLHARLQKPADYAGLIFSSPRSVEAVLKALGNAEIPGGWKKLHNYVVGEKTYQSSLKDLQLQTDGKQSGNAQALAEFIKDNYKGSKHLPFLYPCSNKTTDKLCIKLREVGFLVESCEVYETKCSTELDVKLEPVLNSENVEYLCFFAPQCVDCVHEYFIGKKIPMDKYRLVALGPTTRNALEKKGLRVYGTAERPTMECLINVLTKSQ